MAFKGGFVSPAKLIQQLESNDAALTELDLSDNSSYKMKSLEYTKKIGEALKSNSNLKKLILKGLEIDDQGVTAIADALSVNKGLNLLVLEKNKIGSTGAEAIANGLKQNTTLTELNLLGNKEFGEQCLFGWIGCFEYNVTLTKIVWRLNSRQSFTINKCISRNVEIQKKIKEGKNIDNLLPKHCVAISRSSPVAEHKIPSHDDDQSTKIAETKEEPSQQEPAQEEPAQEETAQEEPAQEEPVNETPQEEQVQEEPVQEETPVEDN